MSKSRSILCMARIWVRILELGMTDRVLCLVRIMDIKEDIKDMGSRFMVSSSSSSSNKAMAVVENTTVSMTSTGVMEMVMGRVRSMVGNTLILEEWVDIVEDKEGMEARQDRLWWLLRRDIVREMLRWVVVLGVRGLVLVVVVGASLCECVRWGLTWYGVMDIRMAGFVEGGRTTERQGGKRRNSWNGGGHMKSQVKICGV